MGHPDDGEDILPVPPHDESNKYKNNFIFKMGHPDDGEDILPVPPHDGNNKYKKIYINILKHPDDGSKKYKKNNKIIQEPGKPMDCETTRTKPAPVLQRTTSPRSKSHLSGAGFLDIVTKQPRQRNIGRCRYNTLPTNSRNKRLKNFRVFGNKKKNDKFIRELWEPMEYETTQTKYAPVLPPTGDAIVKNKGDKNLLGLGELMECEATQSNTLDYIMMPRTWMWSYHIDLVMNLLQNKRPKIDGSGKYVRILNIRNNHWITVSNVFSQDEETIYVYDSAFGTYGRAENKQICEFVPRLNNKIKIIFSGVQQQSAEGNNCGFFASAFASALYSETRPEMIKMDEKSLRQSISEMLQKDVLTLEFERVVKPSPFKVTEVYINCKCKLPSDNIDMIECTNCKIVFYEEC